MRPAEAQRAWAGRPVAERLVVLRRLRRTIARDPDLLLRSLADRPNRNATETLLAEILPIADACNFLEREAGSLLAPRRPGLRGRPLWLTGVRAEVRREPWGIVLVIGPKNYPLLLTAVPAIQALTAGCRGDQARARVGGDRQHLRRTLEPGGPARRPM